MDIMRSAEKVLHMIIEQPPEAENVIASPNGLRAFTVTDPDGRVTVVFAGTGSGEWIDNGEGLAGEEYATEQQLEALRWFKNTAKQKGWTKATDITVAGHSKGGNKAQFITMYSPLVDRCFSYDGQGFSPEAIAVMPYPEHRDRIYSFSAYNDFVNVLGESIVIKEQNYYFDAPMGREDPTAFHYPEAMLNANGRFNEQRETGGIAEYISAVSDKLMSLCVPVRKKAVLGVMNLFQKYIGKGIPVNNDFVSPETTVTGVMISFVLLLSGFIDFFYSM